LSLSAAMRSKSGAKGVSLGLDRRLVEARGVVVADLAAALGFRALARSGFLEDRRQHRADVLVELAEAPPGRLVRRDRVGLQPRAARVLVEIDARLDASIDRRRVEHGGQGLLQRVRRRLRVRRPSQRRRSQRRRAQNDCRPEDPLHVAVLLVGPMARRPAPMTTVPNTTRPNLMLPTFFVLRSKSPKARNGPHSRRESPQQLHERQRALDLHSAFL
jgi:hypothetical protein